MNNYYSLLQLCYNYIVTTFLLHIITNLLLGIIMLDYNICLLIIT